jgi:hypothetical protein
MKTTTRFLAILAAIASLAMWSAAYAAEEPEPADPIDQEVTAEIPVVIPAKNVNKHTQFQFTVDMEHQNVRVIWQAGHKESGVFVRDEYKDFRLEDEPDTTDADGNVVPGAKNWTAFIRGVDVTLPARMRTTDEAGVVAVLPRGTQVRIKGVVIYRALIQALRNAGAF